MTINGEEIDTFADTDGYTNKKTLIITHVSFKNVTQTVLRFSKDCNQKSQITIWAIFQIHMFHAMLSSCL